MYEANSRLIKRAGFLKRKKRYANRNVAPIIAPIVPPYIDNKMHIKTINALIAQLRIHAKEVLSNFYPSNSSNE
jgi:hypothetical protein